MTYSKKGSKRPLLDKSLDVGNQLMRFPPTKKKLKLILGENEA